MRTACLVSLCVLGGHAFAPPRAPARSSVRMMWVGFPSNVRQTTPNQQFAAGATGWTVGLLTGGPFLGSAIGYAWNQCTKVDGVVGDSMLKLGETAIDGWNGVGEQWDREIGPRLRRRVRWEQGRAVYGYPEVAEHMDWVRFYLSDKQFDRKFFDALESIERFGLPASRRRF